MDELREIVGKEQPLDHFHLTLRRAAGRVPGVSAYGACLVSCADERLGVTRAGFDRDVATSLISDVTNPRDRVFAISNLCGRLESGALGLVDEHFTRTQPRGDKLLIVEIASHVGRIKTPDGFSFGHVERFGRRSACCGALHTLLEAPETAPVARQPWFEQLRTLFGPKRIASLKSLDESRRMIAAAIVHAVIQAESAVTDVLEHAPETATHVVIVAGVVVNQQWADGLLPVAVHHLHADAGIVRLKSGFSLRTTPETLAIDVSGPRIRVDGGVSMEQADRVVRRMTAAAQGDPAGADSGAADSGAADSAPAARRAEAMLEQLTPEHREHLDRRLDTVREQVEAIRHDPAAWRSYSRPILRGLFRGLSVVQPELGLAALLYEGGDHLFRAQRLREIVERGPATREGRRALHDIEAELQQLNHEDAQQVLDILISKKPPA